MGYGVATIVLFHQPAQRFLQTRHAEIHLFFINTTNCSLSIRPSVRIPPISGPFGVYFPHTPRLHHNRSSHNCSSNTFGFSFNGVLTNGYGFKTFFAILFTCTCTVLTKSVTRRTFLRSSTLCSNGQCTSHLQILSNPSNSNFSLYCTEAHTLTRRTSFVGTPPYFC